MVNRIALPGARCLARATIRSGILLMLAGPVPSTATDPPGAFFAGVDSTGRAQAQSNADGYVLIESPEYPRGLWLRLVDSSGLALAGLQVDYRGLPDSLVALHCVDPAGKVRETLLWSRPSGNALPLTLKAREPDEKLPALQRYHSRRTGSTILRHLPI